MAQQRQKTIAKKPSASLPRRRGAPAVLALGIAGGVLLCLVEVTTVVEISVGGTVRAEQTGEDQHGLALLILGVAAMALAWLATSSRAGIVLAALSVSGRSASSRCCLGARRPAGHGLERRLRNPVGAGRASAGSGSGSSWRPRCA